MFIDIWDPAKHLKGIILKNWKSFEIIVSKTSKKKLMSV